MSDALQHAMIAALVALGALLEARRRRELERRAEEHERHLEAMRRSAQRERLDSSSESSSGSNETWRPKDS